MFSERLCRAQPNCGCRRYSNSGSGSNNGLPDGMAFDAKAYWNPRDRTDDEDGNERWTKIAPVGTISQCGCTDWRLSAVWPADVTEASR
jgi:hypothetical protein